jgi:glycerol-1-phosphate dehydrogenase [NAD(P)+]
MYEKVKEKYSIDFTLPAPDFVVEQLKNAGCIYDPKTLGIEKEVFRQSVIHAKEIRPRYTVLQLAQDLGILEQAADELAELYY